MAAHPFQVRTPRLGAGQGLSQGRTRICSSLEEHGSPTVLGEQDPSIETPLMLPLKPPAPCPHLYPSPKPSPEPTDCSHNGQLIA